MKAMAVVGTAALFLLLGTAVPAFAQEEHHEQEAKPEKQQAAKPAQHEEKAKPAQREEKAAPARQEEHAKPAPARQEEHAKAAPARQEEHAKPARQEENRQAKGQYAHDGQKDSRGHVYSANRFGRDHHARFVVTGGRLSNGRREYSYGGYWFYANAYPPWFYQQDVYFIMGADGLWYAVSYGDPSLTFQVDIE